MRYLATTVCLLFTLLMFGNSEVSSLAFLSEYKVKMELESKLAENEKFLIALGLAESTGNPDTVNTIGAIGMWQFMPYTLTDLGYGHVTLEKFKSDPSIFPLAEQRNALDTKIAGDLHQLQDQWFREIDINYIEKYAGKSFRGIDTVTVAGILAACHLGGVYGTMRFFDTHGEHNPDDVFGSSIYDYLKKFSEYSYYIEKPIKEELICLKILEEDFNNLTHLLRSLKSCTKEKLLPEMGTALTFIWPKTSTLSGDTPNSWKPSRWDLKLHCQNTTEVCCYFAAVQHVGTAIQLEMPLARSNGTTAKSGKGLYGQIKTHPLQYVGTDYFNSTSSLFGMPLGISNLPISLRNSAFKRLKNFPHLGVA